MKVKVYGVKEPSSDKSAQAAEALDEHQIEFLGEQVFKLPSLIYSEQGLSLPLQHPTAGSVISSNDNETAFDFDSE